MKYFMLSTALLLAAFSTGTYAQGTDKNTLPGQQIAINQPSAIISKLRPVVVNGTAQNNNATGATRQFALDIPNAVQVLPDVIRTETTWQARGKNEQRAVDHSTVDMQQLVPILIAALQEQMLRIDELKRTIGELNTDSTAIIGPKRYCISPNQ